MPTRAPPAPTPASAHSPPEQLEEHAAQREPVGAAVVRHSFLQHLRSHVPVGAPVGAERGSGAVPGRRAQGGQGRGHTHTLAWGFFLEKSQARPRSEMRTCPNSSRRMFAGCQDTVPPLSSSAARGHGVGSEAGGAHMGQVGVLCGIWGCLWDREVLVESASALGGLRMPVQSQGCPRGLGWVPAGSVVPMGPGGALWVGRVPTGSDGSCRVCGCL